MMRQVVDVGEDVRSIDQSGYVARAATILEMLLDQNPENLETRHLLALCYREHAERYIDESGEPADEEMKQAIEILEAAVDSAPDHPTYRFALCTTLQWCRLGERPSQEACDVVAVRMQRSAELAEQLSRDRPDEWIYAATRVEALIKLANVLNKGKRLEEALVRSQQAIDSGTELSAKFQDCEIFQLWAGHARRRRGDLLMKTPDDDLTLQEYESRHRRAQGIDSRRSVGS